MKRYTRIAVVLLALFGIAAGGAWWALQSWAAKALTRESLIETLEKEWNCRASVKGFNAQLLGAPATLTLSNLALHPRDEEVNKPLDERKPVTSKALVVIPSACLEVNTWALLHGSLHIKQCTLSDLFLAEDVSPEGESSWKTAFRKPPASRYEEHVKQITAAPTAEIQPVNDRASPVQQEPQSTAAAPPKGSAADKPAQQPKKTTPQSPLPFGLIVDRLTITRSAFHHLDRRAKTRTNVSDFTLTISDVDIDAADLANHNQLNISLSGRFDNLAKVRVGEEFKETKLTDFEFSASGVVHPFVAATGAFNPDVLLSVKMNKGAQLGGVMTIGQAAAKDKTFGSLKDKFGIDVADLKIGGELQSDVTTKLRLEQGRTEFLEDVVLSFPDYQATVHAGSWMNGTEDRHEAKLRLLASDALSKQVMSGVSAKVGSSLGKLAESLFSDGQGHLAFDFQSSERLSKPKLELAGQTGALEQMFKGLGGGLLKGLIK